MKERPGRGSLGGLGYRVERTSSRAGVVPLKSSAFHGGLLQQLSSGTKMLAYAVSKMAIACFRFGLHMRSPAR